ncbi:MAG: 16S rRNA (cytosine(1402)-N(4))-methyltransferase RsmH [Candidatus Omnitrophica bacterium]|nr:16S rRNA (cytosine(1402)-N(4))-methyltransferase RsmH [Candidatus Omnitrophota bacterium]
MFKEVLDYLDLKPGQIIVDATIGTGGHSEGILERILPGGRLIGIDRDQESLAFAKERLSRFGDAYEVVYGNFMYLDNILNDLGIKDIDGVLFDLGLSSFQLQDSNRGFSFLSEGPLDMRFDRNSFICAYDLVNNLHEEELSNLLWNFGQERWHSRIARTLVKERQIRPISTTSELVQIVLKAIPSRYRYQHWRIHPATRTFQALRIAVNRELEALETALEKAVKFLNKGSRICVISFHSLEDRIVKNSFRKFYSLGLIKIITPKPLRPTLSELEENPSSRSGKLRVAERI